MKITIDNKEIDVTLGKKVLDIAGEQGIYIPHLCAHPELTPYGGCRICCVEIDGFRGYPTACTTSAHEGMVIRTNTKALKEMRTEILQLILSEHPSACIVCEEECGEFMGTIRKVGTTTGCRWCTKDENCELQQVVDHLELDKLEFPVWYREMPIEDFDPFFDRDYNLCIYCGRCVRTCAEHRKSAVISLKQRGRQTTIGPAFEKNHIDGDCEFCGACVTVCPTGAMVEKNKKWSGQPDAVHQSVCPMCSINCHINVLTRKNNIIGSTPPGEPGASGGDLCVKGRFCLTETVNFPGRVIEPMFRFPEGVGILAWKDAVEKTAQCLDSIDGDKTALFISPSLTSEEMAAAVKFGTHILGTSHITSSALTDAMAAYLSLMEKSMAVEDLRDADTLVSFFLDGTYNYAPVTLALKRMAEQGTPFVQVGWKRDTASRFASHRVIPPAGAESQFIKKIVETLEAETAGTGEARELVEILQSVPSPTLVIGPGMLDLSRARQIIEALEHIIRLTHARVLTVNPFGNLTGLVSLQGVTLESFGKVDDLIKNGKIDILYCVGGRPYDRRPPVNTVIYQSPFAPPHALEADIVLPAPVWGEVSGTYTGMNGKKKKVNALVEPEDTVLPHPEIFTRIAAALKKDTLFAPPALAAYLDTPGWPAVTPPVLHAGAGKNRTVYQPDKSYPFVLLRESNPHKYMDVTLSHLIGGMKNIVPENTLLLNPYDALMLGINSGGPVTIVSRKNGGPAPEAKYPAVTRRTVPRGYAILITPTVPPGIPNPSPAHIKA